MLSSVRLEHDHPRGPRLQLNPGATGPHAASRASPTAHSNDGPDCPSSDLQGLAHNTLRDPRARSEQVPNCRLHLVLIPFHLLSRLSTKVGPSPSSLTNTTQVGDEEEHGRYRHEGEHDEKKGVERSDLPRSANLWRQ